MGKFAEMVPERVRALASYVPGKPIHQAEAESGVKMIKLGSNENPFGPSPLAIRAMDAATSPSTSIRTMTWSHCASASPCIRHRAQPAHRYRRLH